MAYVMSHALACDLSRLLARRPRPRARRAHTDTGSLSPAGFQNSPTLHIPSFVLLLLEAPSLPGGCDAGLASSHDVGPGVIARPGGKA